MDVFRAEREREREALVKKEKKGHENWVKERVTRGTEAGVEAEDRFEEHVSAREKGKGTRSTKRF